MTLVEIVQHFHNHAFKIQSVMVFGMASADESPKNCGKSEGFKHMHYAHIFLSIVNHLPRSEALQVRPLVSNALKQSMVLSRFACMACSCSLLDSVLGLCVDPYVVHMCHIDLSTSRVISDAVDDHFNHQCRRLYLQSDRLWFLSKHIFQTKLVLTNPALFSLRIR